MVELPVTTTRRRRPRPEASDNDHRPPQIRKLGDADKINILVYSNPGVGKTRFLGTGPEKTLILRPPVDHVVSIKNRNLSEWVIKDWHEMYEALEYLRDNRGDGWEWVWLDSISLWQDIGLDDIWAGVVAKKESRAEYGLDKGEYGVNMFRLAQWVRHIVGSAYFHFGITAHPFRVIDPFTEDQDDASEIMMPYVQGKQMAEKVCGYMNMVAYLHIVKDKKTGKSRRVMRFSAGAKWYAKDQFDAVPNGRLVDPTLPKLIALINASREGGQQ